MRKTWIVLAVGCALVAIIQPNAIAKSGSTFTRYAYEEGGPHSLLPPGDPGYQFIDPTCTPSWTNCKVFEFGDRWDLAAGGNETDQTNVIGYLDDHGIDYFSGGTTSGTFTVTFFGSSTTWTGPYSGVFRGPNAGTGSFSLTGTDGSTMKGAITFVDDGLMRLTGTLK